MNRINRLFAEKQSEILSLYFSAGYPQLDTTADIIRSLESSGVDLIEIGLPFSDPLADGPTIQKSSEVALENGMSTSVLFEQLKDIRQHAELPLIIMGYINPVLQYGMENFCKKCQEIGIDGLILPDMPLEVYEREYRSIFERYGLKNIFLITPQTSAERIRKIDELTDAFIYMVSSASTTGSKSGFQPDQIQYFERIQAMKLQNPCLIGFGISTADSFQQAGTYANGAIIGSAFIKAIENGVDKIPAFVSKIKGKELI